MKKILICLLLCAFVLGGCSSVDLSNQNAGTVKLTILGPDQTILDEELSFAEGMSAYDITLSALKNKDMSFETEGSGQSLYFKRIGDFGAGDYGDMSGWLYYINSKSAEVGCSSYKLKDGDTILWKYTDDFTKEELFS